MRISDWSSDVCSSDLVTSRIEDAVSSIDSVDYFESVSSSGLSTVTVTFKSGVDSAAAVAEVRAQVETLVDQLPTDVLTPVVTQFSIDAAPILYLSLSSEHRSAMELTELVDTVNRPPLSTMNGVGSEGHRVGKRSGMRCV